MAGQQSKSDGKDRQSICKNRKVSRMLAIHRRLEAGLVLTGSEVKSLRAGDAQLNEAYVVVRQGEASLIGSHIGPYRYATSSPHQANRSRKLLLHQHQLESLDRDLQQGGYTALPAELYFSGSWVKLEICVGKGKSNVDRRQDLKAQDAKREIAKAFAHKQRRSR